MSTAQPAIRVENLSKRFKLRTEAPTSLKEAITSGRRSKQNEFWALKDVDFEVPAGTMFGLVGHNGSGKSTLLRCIAGIYRPTSGRVVTDGRISALLELGSGFHPDLTGRENIYLNAAIIGLSKAEVDERFDDIVEFSGIGRFLDTPIKHYSSGMYVRLGFAVAVHVDPEILIIDEVITVGDEEFQRKCFDHLYGLRRKGVTIVVVSHSLTVVQTMCDMAAWLHRGEVRTVGTAVEVVDAYLQRVNAAEREGGSTGSAAVGESELGGGEMAITAIELRRGDEVVPAATNGEPLTFRLHWVAREPVRDPVFAVSIRHENGTVVTSASTANAPIDLGTCSGSGWIDLVMDDMPLVAGSYEVFTSILDESSQHAFYHQDGGLHLPVRPGRAPVIPGLVDLRPRWEKGQGS